MDSFEKTQEKFSCQHSYRHLIQQDYSLKRLHQQVLIIAIIYDIDIFIFINIVLNVLAGISGGGGGRKPHMK